MLEGILSSVMQTSGAHSSHNNTFCVLSRARRGQLQESNLRDGAASSPEVISLNCTCMC